MIFFYHKMYTYSVKSCLCKFYITYSYRGLNNELGCDAIGIIPAPTSINK